MTEHHPTPQSRAKVIGLACNAIRQDRIAKHLGIDPKTLRKHYHDFRLSSVSAAVILISAGEGAVSSPSVIGLHPDTED